MSHSHDPIALYRDLVPWYRLIDPPEDHRLEVEHYRSILASTVEGRAESLLELGAGAGHNALYLKQYFRCTLTDISPEMRALNQELNPECEHLSGDMRTLRLDRTFDVVLVHDAIMYMLTQEDLRAAAETAFVHTRHVFFFGDGTRIHATMSTLWILHFS